MRIPGPGAACDTTWMRPALAIALAAAAACGTAPPITTSDGAAPIDADPGPDELPCDVRAILEAACTTCHAAPPNSNAQVALTSRLAFLGPSSSDGATIARRARALLVDREEPMPPRSEPRLAVADLATLDAWLAAGSPPGAGATACGAISARPAPTTCASGTFWTRGDEGAREMHPGKACRACHLQQAPELAYYFAGTGFDDFHAQDDCNSPPPPDARIEILDSAGAIALTLVPDTVGNFTSLGVAAGVPLPYTARLVANGLVRAMQTPQDSGDCNACHTEQGTNANNARPDDPAPPGRLVWPRPRT